MEKIITDDESITFFNEKYQEHYHTKPGAVEEAFKKFVEPCKVAELAKQGSIKILDVCFGIGYNSAAAIEVALKANPSCKIGIVGLENDKNILAELLNLNPPLKQYDLIKSMAKNNFIFGVIHL